MTGEQAKEALKMALPIEWRSPINGTIPYIKVTAIIYRYIYGKIAISLELLDRNGHSVTVAPIEQVFSPVHAEKE